MPIKKRPNTNQQSQLYPIVDYIQTQYNQTLEIPKLEQLSYYSYRNLQRIFKAIYGETIGSYQKRLRLEKAAKLMSYSNSQSISDIALTVGYADLQAFRKAFKKHYGIAPPKLQEILKTIHPELPNTNFPLLEPTIVKLPAIQVVYNSYRGAYNNDQLNQTWDLLLDNCHPNPQLQHYGIIYDDPDITKAIYCQYDACIENAPNLLKEPTTIPISKKTIPAQRYLCFEHQGSYDLLDDTHNAIFGGWLLQQTDKEFTEGPILEHCAINYRQTDKAEDYLTYIYIPY
ncbi:MAG: AraC family transcriptional regulator [Aureispira sp.]|nr:AraC family transcriptional regulator [Aureispira sp.]